eukprot:GGOE01015308.1.p1 GENE.GGOE01015308.1~~GGOE01015308.1.p1  ORF type:complete len:899 (+),score=284.43 GGOE01015308.1:238-2697(+)
MANSLECFQLLILGGWFSGLSAEEQPGAPEPRSSAMRSAKYIHALHTFVDCVTVLYNYPSFNIQRSVVQCLSLAVVSPRCGLNGELLLSAFRTTYNVALMSRSEEVQKAARDAITRMLGVVLDHLEEASLEADGSLPQQPPQPGLSGAPSSEASSTSSVRIDGFTPHTEPSDAHRGSNSTATTPLPQPPSLPREGRQDVENSTNHFSSTNEKGGNPLRPKQVNDPKPLEQQVSPSAPRRASPEVRSSVVQENFLLVTRSLSRLSRRSIGDSPQLDSVLVQSRVYAVELLCILFAGFGKRCAPPMSMVPDMRSYALECILTNICTTTPPTLFTMSVNIFRSLMCNVRAACKHQLTVVASRVLLPILTLNCSSFSQKITILELLQNTCLDARILMEIFLNNDCDKRCIALYENMAAALSRTVLTNHAEKHWITPQQSAIVQHCALQALVTLLKALKAHAPTVEAVDTPEWLLYQLRLVRTRTVWNAHGWKRGYAWMKENEPSLEPHEFLWRAPSLSATEIGGFFSPNKPVHLKAFEDYLSFFNFSGKQIDMALRELMVAFRIAGESQIIDRLFTLFAKKYNADNNQPFTDDGAYFLSFATIMLHTQKHNPNAEQSAHMSKENFISYQAGQNGGQDFSRELLSDIYDRISRFEIKIEHDTEPTPSMTEAELEEACAQASNDREAERTTEIHSNMFLPHAKVKQLMFVQASRNLVRDATGYLRRYQHPYEYVEIGGAEVIGTMFSLAWPHVLAAVRYTMQRTDDFPPLALCYEALHHGSDLAVRFLIDTDELDEIAQQLTPPLDSRLPGPYPQTYSTCDVNAF